MHGYDREQEMIEKFKKLCCFRGYSTNQCPLHRLEVERTLYAALAVIATALVTLCSIMGH